MKICKQCNKEKRETSFSTNGKTKDGKGKRARKAICNSCKELNSKETNPNRDLKKSLNRYGITLDFYNQMLDNQKFRCKICNKHEDDFDRRLCVDHCHDSLAIRGLLCNNCNTLIGMANDNIGTLESSIKYLKESCK